MFFVSSACKARILGAGLPIIAYYMWTPRVFVFVVSALLELASIAFLVGAARSGLQVL